MISIARAAELLSVNPRTIRRYIAAGRLPGYRVGSHTIRVRLDDVDAILHPIPTAGQ
jgi:excisionase family DNA binding protein